MTVVQSAIEYALSCSGPPHPKPLIQQLTCTGQALHVSPADQEGCLQRFTTCRKLGLLEAIQRSVSRGNFLPDHPSCIYSRHVSKATRIPKKRDSPPTPEESKSVAVNPSNACAGAWPVVGPSVRSFPKASPSRQRPWFRNSTGCGKL